LTLPGIAGIILAVGMAVDSNVLMFERIREEIRIGKTPKAAIDSGYDKAFWTIFDSHVTTLITAIVLFQFGTGPIKGFAVTLGWGVFINLFTALIGTKTIFDFITTKWEIKRLSI
jgi:preprotein translocase subunit SecD